MTKISAFRFCVFWIWSFTLLVVIGVFIQCLISRSMAFSEIDESMTQVVGLLIPQVSIMIAFFFGSTKKQQSMILQRQRALSSFALALSAIYHFVFWIVIWLAISKGIFGATIDENTSAAIKIVGFVSIFGLAPVAYLFASGVAVKS